MIFEELKESLVEAVEISQNKRPASRLFEITPADIKETRKNLNMTQEQFSMMMGISCATLRNWQQARRIPEGPARALLLVAAKHPEALLDSLH